MSEVKQQLVTAEHTVVVSIIVPVYNASKYIHASIDSVLKQTYKNWELICVDDCSSDDSFAILEEYAKQDSRIKVYRMAQNGSALQARKLAIEHATGKYIMFLDPDDEYYPKACQIAVAAMEKHHTDILQFGININSAGNISYEKIQWLREFFRPKGKYLKGKEILKAAFVDRTLVWNLLNKIFKTELVKEAHSSIGDLKLYLCNDVYIFFRIAYLASSYYDITDILYNYFPERGFAASKKTYTFDLFYKESRTLYMEENLKKFLILHNDLEQWQKIPASFGRDANIECLNLLELYSDSVLRQQCIELYWQSLKGNGSALALWEKYTEASHEKQQLQCMICEYRAQVDKLQKDLAELKAVKSGWSFRIGRAITWLPRKLFRRP